MDAEAVRAPIAELVNANQLSEAMGLCATAREAFPADPWLPTMHGYLLLRLGRSEQAAEAAGVAIALGSDDPLAVLVLGVAHRNRGRHAQAAEALLSASRLMPDRVDAATMVIEETAAAHGIDAARPVYQEVFARLPDHAVATCWGELLFGAGLEDEMPPGILAAPILSVRDALARAGATPDVEGERELILLEEPPVFGEPNPDRFKGGVPGYVPYATALSDVTILSKSSLVLTADGAALNDTLADPRFGRFLVLSHDKAIRHREGDRVLVDLGAYELQDLDAGVMLSGWASEHFGHWVPEYVCRLAYLVHHPRFAELPLIVDAGMPPQHLEYLRLLVANPIVEIPPGGGLRCRELVVGSPSCFFPVNMTPDHEIPPEYQGGLPTGGFRFIRDGMRARLGPPAATGRKLYLSRKTRAWRRLLNEDEVAAELAARGFEVLFPEDMSFEEQVRMFQSAEVVVAPNGSSLLNAMFAPQDLKLIVLSQRGLFNWATFYGPMRELGYDMTFVCSDAETGEKHGDYAIPLQRLIAALDAPAG